MTRRFWEARLHPAAHDVFAVWGEAREASIRHDHEAQAKGVVTENAIRAGLAARIG
jgi:hypothetical protein